ncbi:TetR/AcrR family transcriptional regulator [Kineococcus sp. NUM-3379]
MGLIAEKGLAGTSTADICRAAGISSGALFHYFASKQEVFYGIFELDRSEWDEAFAAAAADPDAWHALRGVVDRMATETRHPVVAGLLVEVIAQAHRDPRTAELVAEGDRRMVRGIGELVARLADDGLADPGMPPEEAARWVLTLVESFYGRGYPEPDRDHDADVATVKELVARVLRLRGQEVSGAAR